MLRYDVDAFVALGDLCSTTRFVSAGGAKDAPFFRKSTSAKFDFRFCRVENSVGGIELSAPMSMLIGVEYHEELALRPEVRHGHM